MIWIALQCKANFRTNSSEITGRCSRFIASPQVTSRLCGKIVQTSQRNGPGSRVRTCDPLFPKQVRYQTALCPDASSARPGSPRARIPIVLAFLDVLAAYHVLPHVTSCRDAHRVGCHKADYCILGRVVSPLAIVASGPVVSFIACLCGPKTKNPEIFIVRVLWLHLFSADLSCLRSIDNTSRPATFHPCVHQRRSCHGWHGDARQPQGAGWLLLDEMLAAVSHKRRHYPQSHRCVNTFRFCYQARYPAEFDL